MASITPAEIEQLAINVDQLLLSHDANGHDWLPLPKVAASGLQLLLKDLRPGRPEGGPASPAGASSPAPADPPLPGASAKVPDVSPGTAPVRP
jgi:hypothetical protein